MRIRHVGFTCYLVAILLFAQVRVVFAEDIYSLDLESSFDQYARVANNLGISNGPITMEGWFKLEMFPSSQGYNLMTHSDEATDVDIRVLYGADNTLHFLRSRDNVGAENYEYVLVNFDYYAWHHIAITYDGTYVRGYLDGNLVLGPFSSVGNGISGGVDEFAVGQYIENIPYMPGYDGKVDDVRVWNYARSQIEISSFKDQEMAGNEPGLVAYYRFENNLDDSTSNGFHMAGPHGYAFSPDVAIVPPPTPLELTEALVVTVEALNVQAGIINSLDEKLNAALSALNDTNEANNEAAINSLFAFISATEAQRDKKISSDDADLLIAGAQSIIDLLTE